MRVALVNKRISDKNKTALLKRGFFFIDMPPAERISEPLSSHPDMLVAKLGDNIITTADYIERAPHVFSDIREYAPHVRIHVSDEKYDEKYPRDAILNVLTLGKRVFLKKDSVSRTVLRLAEELGFEIINTRQGYPACVALALTDNDVITADTGLAITLREWGVSVKLIENGDIALPPYEYGFIGGAAGVCDGTVYFLGNVDSHKNSKQILAKIDSCGAQAVSLSDDALTDLGKIIFL